MRKNTTSWTKMTLCRAFSSLHQAALPEYLKSSGEERAKAKAVPRECDCRAGSKCQVDYAFSALILRPPQTTDVRQAEFNLSHSRPDVTSLSSGCDANLDQSPFIHLQQGAMHVVGVPPSFSISVNACAMCRRSFLSTSAHLQREHTESHQMVVGD